MSSQSAFSSTLYGSTVNSAWYCCAAPTEPYRQTDFALAVVANGIEFSETAYYWFGSGYVSWGGTIDVRETTIEIRSTENGAAGAVQPFGGFTLNFSGAPKILNVTLDPSSSLAPTGISFTDSSILVNASGIARTDTDIGILNVQLAPVPEPAAPLLFLVGGTILFTIRRVATNSDA